MLHSYTDYKSKLIKRFILKDHSATNKINEYSIIYNILLSYIYLKPQSD